MWILKWVMWGCDCFEGGLRGYWLFIEWLVFFFMCVYFIYWVGICFFWCIVYYIGLKLVWNMSLVFVLFVYGIIRSLRLCEVL